MSKLLLLREPGYVYDLQFVFLLHFNFELYVKNLFNDEKKKENVKFYKYILAYFGDIPDDLYVFFHALPSTERAFLPKYCFYTYQCYFNTTYNYEFMYKKLQQKDKLVRELLKFYFCELDDKEVEKCMNSIEELFALIKKSDYSKEEKIKLYEFFVEPDPYIEMLMQEISKKEKILFDYYKNNFHKALEVYNQTSFESIYNELRDIIDTTLPEYNNDEYSFVSYCLLNHCCMCFWLPKEGIYYLLGYNYSSVTDAVRNRDNKWSLTGLGSTISDESRLKILNFLLEKGEANCKDIETALDITGSTIYHHITAMVRAGVVNVRSEKRNMLYSINKNYFDSMIKMLAVYSKKWKGIIV